ncbi:hypothetical protein LCGC14_1400800 [marine sediment metagenome]|uniref:Uncharacterized protein n=1 Tax=marine sediment metagenome TaxID=412755 RepID=A0A0F9JXE8_9ZZZZ
MSNRITRFSINLRERDGRQELITKLIIDGETRGGAIPLNEGDDEAKALARALDQIASSTKKTLRKVMGLSDEDVGPEYI